MQNVVLTNLLCPGAISHRIIVPAIALLFLSCSSAPSSTRPLKKPAHRDPLEILTFNHQRFRVLDAVLAGDEAALNKAIEDGCDIEAADAGTSTPLIMALRAGKGDLAKILIAHGAQTVDCHGENILMASAAGGLMSKVEALVVGKTFPIDQQTVWHQTALLYAAQNGQRNVVDFLLAQGADPLAMNISGESVAHFAAANGDVDLLGVARSRGVDLDRATLSSETPLFYAIMHEQVDAVRYLLGAGANPNFKGDKSYDRTPLRLAIPYGNEEIVRVLLNKGASVELAGGTYSGPVLLVAAATGREGLVAALLDIGADVNARNNEGYTALMVAADMGDAEMIRLLLSRGADATFEDDFCRSALDRAGDAATIEMIRGAVAAPTTQVAPTTRPPAEKRECHTPEAGWAPNCGMVENGDESGELSGCLGECERGDAESCAFVGLRWAGKGNFEFATKMWRKAVALSERDNRKWGSMCISLNRSIPDLPRIESMEALVDACCSEGDGMCCVSIASDWYLERHDPQKARSYLFRAADLDSISADPKLITCPPEENEYLHRSLLRRILRESEATAQGPKTDAPERNEVGGCPNKFSADRGIVSE